MKKKSREVNIFSMSALDLFASAMGAFMLLAVIALPFFGNTSSTPPQKCPEVEVKKCPKVECPKVTCPKVTAKPFKNVDLVIVLDISGSMEKQLNFLKSDIRGIGQLLGSLSESSAIRVVVFGDDGFSKPVTAFPLTPVNQLSRLQGYVDSITLNLGMGSGKNTLSGESVYGGTSEALNTSWRSQTDVKSVVIITDDEPHPGQSSLLNNAVAQFSRTPNERVSVFFTGNNKANLESYYEQLARSGKGSFFNANSTSMTAGIILSLIDK